jgi:hypothetical protein
MASRILIPAHKAVIYWNDVPAGGLDDVLVASIDDPSVDRIAAKFENSNGAIVDDWLNDPRSTPEAIFEAFMASEPVTSATPEFLVEIRNGWLLEFAKIDRCDWARSELAKLPDDEDGRSVSSLAMDLREVFGAWTEDYAGKLLKRLDDVPDQDMNEFYLLVHEEYRVLGDASPLWMKFLMELVDAESDRRRREAERADRFAAQHGMSVERASQLLDRVKGGGHDLLPW